MLRPLTFTLGDGFFSQSIIIFLSGSEKKGKNINVQGMHKKDNIKGRTIPEKTILFCVEIFEPYKTMFGIF